MKIREQAIRELECMNSIELMVIYDLILSLKRRDEQTKYAKTGKSKSYIKVRNALKNCKGSMSEDILSEREDRI